MPSSIEELEGRVMIETGRIITNYFGLHGTKDTYDEMYRLDVSTHWHKNNSPG